MSSDRPRRAVTLRTRLVTGQLLLLSLVCLVIGVVTVLSLRAFLLDQLGSQVADASDRSRAFAERRAGHPAIQRPPIDAPGQPDGTIAMLISADGTIVDAHRLLLGSGGTAQLTPAQQAQLIKVPVDGKVHGVEMQGIDKYQVISVHTRRGEVVITGLPMRAVNATLTTAIIVLLAVSGCGLIVAGITGADVIRRTLRPLNRVAATASRVAELPLDRGEVALSVRVAERDTDPRTEVGQVGAALNRMLGHVDNALAVRHASETRVRQFVADASHELRTPLTSIRGYAELAKRHGGHPPEVAHALDRVESEAKRMSGLVEDLLLLARLDSGRPLDVRSVDLSRVVVDAVSDARVAGQDHTWTLDLPAEPALALGDEERLHQVVANLLANGRTHTPAGTTISTKLRSSGGWVTLTVSDDGPGIPSELQPEVFERFARGDSSRSRAAGSTGLGLAIVAAVVQAHGGTASIDSRPGSTVATITLPAAVDTDTSYGAAGIRGDAAG